jgi:uncharacterized protein YcgI (DUF1989 family)
MISASTAKRGNTPAGASAQVGVARSDSEVMLSTERQQLAPQSGTAFQVTAGSLLRIIDANGEQVADLVAFGLDREEWLSSGRSIDYNSTLRFTAGHILYSNRSRPMLTITRDTVGRHDFLFAPCSPEMFARLYGVGPGHPSCFENLALALTAFGIPADRIPTTFNAFMNADIRPDGEIKVVPPLSKAGDLIELRAEMDLIVGLTACSAELSNNWRFKPIDYEILTPPRREIADNLQ